MTRSCKATRIGALILSCAALVHNACWASSSWTAFGKGCLQGCFRRPAAGHLAKAPRASRPRALCCEGVGRGAWRRLATAGRALRQEAAVAPAPAWDLESVAAWRDLGHFQDHSDPRGGQVQFFEEPGTGALRGVHSVYGPLPLEGQAGPTEEDGAREVRFGSRSCKLGADGFAWADGSLSRRLPDAETGPRAGTASRGQRRASAAAGPRADEADRVLALVNAVRVLGPLTFPDDVISQVRDSDELLKQAVADGWRGGAGAPEGEAFRPQVPEALQAYEIDGAWEAFPAGRSLFVRGWGPFDVAAAHGSWRAGRQASDVPTPAALRSHGYVTKWFAGVTEESRGPLLAVFESPEAPLARYLQRHKEWWNHTQRASRVDEVEHFCEQHQGLERDEGLELRPAELLEHVELERKMAKHPWVEFKLGRKVSSVAFLGHDGEDYVMSTLKDSHAVVRVGEAMKNCAAQYIDRCSEGSTVLVVLQEAVGKFVGLGEWRLGRGWQQRYEAANQPMRKPWMDLFAAFEELLPGCTLTSSSSTQWKCVFCDPHSDATIAWRLLFPNTVQTLNASKWAVVDFGKLADADEDTALQKRGQMADTAWRVLAETGLGQALLLRATDAAEMSYLAVSKSKEALAEQLLEHGTDPESLRLFPKGSRWVGYRERPGETPLALAVRRLNAGVARALVGHGAQIRGSMLDTAVDHCLHGRYSEVFMEMVNLLLEGGAKQPAAPAWRPGALATVLRASGARGWLQTLRLLHAQGVDLDTRNAGGWSALDEAVGWGEVEAIELLVDLGADPDLADAFGWRTPLYWAILWGQEGAAEALLRRGADGDSLLLACAERGEYDHVRELAALGADVNTRRSPTAPTPLMILVLGNLSKFEEALVAARSLVERGADLEAADEHGRTVLLQAAEGGSVPACRWLLERGADLEHEDSKGQTALVLATKAGHAGVVEHLVEGGADLEHKDSKGQTALVLATKAGHAGVVEHLLARGCAGEHVRAALVVAAETYRHKLVDVIWQAAAKLDEAEEFKKAARDGALNAGHWNMAEKVEKLR